MQGIATVTHRTSMRLDCRACRFRGQAPFRFGRLVCVSCGARSRVPRFRQVEVTFPPVRPEPEAPPPKSWVDAMCDAILAPLDRLLSRLGV